MARIGIDLDGVGYDFAASLKGWLVDTGQRTPEQCPDPVRWEFYLDWGLTLEEFLGECAYATNAGIMFRDGDPLPGFVEGLERLKSAGHSLHIITDRSFGWWGAAQSNTMFWLGRHKIPFDTITYAADKTVVRTSYMIDDKLGNYDALNESACWPSLLNRPWNAVEGGDHRHRVDSVEEFVNAVLFTECNARRMQGGIA